MYIPYLLSGHWIVPLTFYSSCFTWASFSNPQGGFTISSVLFFKLKEHNFQVGSFFCLGHHSGLHAEKQLQVASYFGSVELVNFHYLAALGNFQCSWSSDLQMQSKSVQKIHPIPNLSYVHHCLIYLFGFSVFNLVLIFPHFLTENNAQRRWMHFERQQWAQQVACDWTRRSGHVGAICRSHYPSS